MTKNTSRTDGRIQLAPPKLSLFLEWLLLSQMSHYFVLDLNSGYLVPDLPYITRTVYRLVASFDRPGDAN